MTQQVEFRDSVASGDYARALDAWREYAAAIAAAGPTEESLAGAAELITWARPLLTAARADAAQRLLALHVAGAYDRLPNVRSALFRMSF